MFRTIILNSNLKVYKIQPLINDSQNYEIKNNKNDVDFLCHSLTHMFIGAASTSLTKKLCKSKIKNIKNGRTKAILLILCNNL